MAIVKLPPTLTNHPSLVGIIRFPKVINNTQVSKINVVQRVKDKYVSVSQEVDLSLRIMTKNKEESATIQIPNQLTTDFFPYTYYVLTDGECEPLIMHPQYMAGSLSIGYDFALSHQPIERYYPTYYKGDSSGRIYNITNFQQMMLPVATNEGMSYMSANANSMAQGRKTAQMENIINGVAGIGNVASNIFSGNIGGAVGAGLSTIAGGLSGANKIKEIDARNKDMTMTPSSITSYGTPSTRDAFKNNEVRVLKYQIDGRYKDKINKYVERFGNKFNNYDTISLQTYKGYIKFISPDIDSGIDNIYLQKIIEILERGIYIE